MATTRDDGERPGGGAPTTRLAGECPSPFSATCADGWDGRSDDDDDGSGGGGTLALDVVNRRVWTTDGIAARALGHRRQQQQRQQHQPSSGSNSSSSSSSRAAAAATAVADIRATSIDVRSTFAMSLGQPTAGHRGSTLNPPYPLETGAGVHPLSVRVRYARVWVRCPEIGPAVYPCKALLADKGADLSVQNNDGDTSLLFTEKNGHNAIVKLLKQYS